MFLDGRNLNGSEISADLCIVGAGAAGISLALEFIGRGLSVVLLESGGFEYDDKTQSLYDGENNSFVDFPLETTRLRYFGGTTNHWGGMTYPFSEFDFTPRQYIPVTGWPISYSELTTYYPRAGILCQLGRMDYRDVAGWQRLIGIAPVRLQHGPMLPAVAEFSPPTRFGITYRDPLRRAANVKVILNSNVQELIANTTASEIERVEVKCIGGASYRVTAHAFTIAVGGLETARLLLLSRGQQPTGLGNGNDLVGRFYMDHPGFSGGELRLAPSAPDFDFFMNFHKISDSQVQGIFIPRTEVLAQENIGNFRIFLSPRPDIPGIDSLKTLTQDPFDWRTFSEIGRHIANVLVDIDEVSDVLYKNIMHRKIGFLNEGAHGKTKYLGGIMQVSVEQVPNRESRVTLCEKFDFFGQQQIKLSWRLQDADRHTLVRSFDLFASAISGAGYGRVRLPPDLGKPWMDSFVQLACHPMGTTRMSDSPKTGVVDRNCRVHGISNLFVASSSVFPTSSWVNPTLTIVALAIRLADYLKVRYG